MSISRKKEWFDNNAFWRDLYPLLDKRFAAAPGEVALVLELTKPKGKAVLDLCCGPGRCAIALAQRGFTVTGVDRTKFYLEKARAKARAAQLKIEWIRQDMRDFVRPNTFDLVINMFTSFGYFDRKGEDLIVLKNIFASLRPGGTCLIDVMGKEVLAGVAQPTTSELLDDGTTLVVRHQVFDDWTRIRNEWIFIRQGKVRRYQLHHTIYSGQELRERMEQVGFTAVKLYGSLAGDEYGLNAQRLIAVGKKPLVNRRRHSRGKRGNQV